MDIIPHGELSKYLTQRELFNLIQTSKRLCDIYQIYLNQLKEWVNRRADRYHIIIRESSENYFSILSNSYKTDIYLTTFTINVGYTKSDPQKNIIDFLSDLTGKVKFKHGDHLFTSLNGLVVNFFFLNGKFLPDCEAFDILNLQIENPFIFYWNGLIYREWIGFKREKVFIRKELDYLEIRSPFNPSFRIIFNPMYLFLYPPKSDYIYLSIKLCYSIENKYLFTCQVDKYCINL